ncbi:regulator of chromosome condensation 1/beta-lactamase-inhibitor protein II [Dichotomocladium elegans]|nr:regulator of chromosome condensation 1/beta-lactamase-inhibitor protein II [Dichotomocladium elegans]
MKLIELPPDVLYSIFSKLSATSLARLERTCRRLRELCNDDLLWKHLVIDDYNVPSCSTYRSSGWKAFYSRLSNSRVFTWGENSDGRLGHRDPPHLLPRSRWQRIITEPRELLSLRGKGIVDIHAGGWSFHALDRHGRAWMWGTLDENNTAGIGRRRIAAPTEVRLPPDVQLRSISCGRSHTIGLARDGSVWQWSNLWVPQRIKVSLPILQVTANWGYSTLLCMNGAIFIVPGPGPVESEDDSIDDYIVNDLPVTLQRIQDDMHAVGRHDLEPFSSLDKIVQVAGLENTTLCLTRFGRILRLATADAVEFVAAPAMRTTELHAFGATESEVNDPDQKMHRFITAQFRNFAVYTMGGKVLLGRQDMSPQEEPRALPALQHDICKVSFGDYHSGALTNGGDLLTWGSSRAGALGHGNNGISDELGEPKKVPFGDMFVFAIGFGGWQSSALAIPRG